MWYCQRECCHHSQLQSDTNGLWQFMESRPGGGSVKCKETGGHQQRHNLSRVHITHTGTFGALSLRARKFRSHGDWLLCKSLWITFAAVWFMWQLKWMGILAQIHSWFFTLASIHGNSDLYRACSQITHILTLATNQHIDISNLFWGVSSLI